MPAFKELGTTSAATGRHQGKVRIYLESTDDVYIFEQCWFINELDKLEFVPAGETAGGCEQVINRVNEDRGVGISAFGIVDRDILLRRKEIELLLENRDAMYLAERPLGPHVKVLCRWEIENYFLDPMEVELVLARLGKRSLREAEEVYTEFLEHCDVLVPVMAANIILHEQAAKALGHGFECDCRDRPTMESAVRGQLTKQCNEIDEDLRKHGDYMNRVEAFGVSNGTDLESRFSRFNRIIDGKRIAQRISHHHKMSEKLWPLVAGAIKEHGKVDQEIVERVTEMKSHFRE